MSVLSSLTEKPWESLTPEDKPEDRIETRKVGLRVLLAVVSMLFFLFLVAFLMRSQYPDWQPLAEEPGHPLYQPSILWLNSIYLILASVFIQWARVKVRNSDGYSVRWIISLGGAFSVAFVVGQVLFWQSLYAKGFVVSANPALSFFYLFTGLHAAHVVIGLLAWVVTLVTAFRHHPRTQHYVELCAIYWHFLLGLWVVLFALLISKPETYDAIAAFCGLR